MAARRVGAGAVALALALTMTACGAGDDPDDRGLPPPSVDAQLEHRPDKQPQSDPTRRPVGPAASYSDWDLGAHPLPLRPDGLGEMGPTPPELIERRLPTRDLLAPPEDGRFHSTIGPVTTAIRQRMGRTWSPACPAGLDDLRYLTLSFRGFDGLAHTGELVVAAGEAEDVVSVFAALFDADFPIEEMRLPSTADLDAHPTGDGNNTAALVCRATTGGSGWSAHAYGLAIDVNPFHNPYQKGDVVLPELASAYLDRSWHRPGMIQPGSLAVREFARIGWSWGGSWSSLKDYQHFTATGR
ncbi:M15 family metallopeptidase [Nocardioides bizhenqiangii]|uniref:M15 family metallopeptidase n=1 Tax=Nocardioides bizhenqiangii TaxID=3095076 RepID=A0ABZ0ZPI3_9ACTN|nr:M15 family metallopeptidase [Nocardioides sp. HM61]WQQ25679.1 M15 family metallopeptidase [Nocardioides sp. HM61]